MYEDIKFTPVDFDEYVVKVEGSVGKNNMAEWINDPNYPLDIPCIIDFGHSFTKCGVAYDGQPRGFFPPYFARIKDLDLFADMNYRVDRTKEYFFGDDCVFGTSMYRLHNVLDKKYNAIPIDQTPWDSDGFQKLIEFMMERELRVTPEENPFLLTSLYRMDDEKYKMLSEIFFEKNNVPMMAIFDSSVLALIYSGTTTGVVVESGAGITQVTPILNCMPIQNSKLILENRQETNVSKVERKPDPLYSGNTMYRSEKHKRPKFSGTPRKRISGDLITDLFFEAFQEKCPQYFESIDRFSISTRYTCVETAKRKLCYVSLPPHLESSDDQETIELKLPDDNVVKFHPKKESWLSQPFEILFNPSIAGYTLPGVHVLTKLAIERIHDESIEKQMMDNILLFGGTTKAKNFPERFSYEFGKIIEKKKKKFTLNAPDDRIFSAWMGGLTAVLQKRFFDEFVKNEEYKEHGYIQIMMKRFSKYSSRYNQEGQMKLLSYGNWSSAVGDVDLEERRIFVVEKCLGGLDFQGKCKSDVMKISIDGQSLVVVMKWMFLL